MWYSSQFDFLFSRILLYSTLNPNAKSFYPQVKPTVLPTPTRQSMVSSFSLIICKVNRVYLAARIVLFGFQVDLHLPCAFFLWGKFFVFSFYDRDKVVIIGKYSWVDLLLHWCWWFCFIQCLFVLSKGPCETQCKFFRRFCFWLRQIHRWHTVSWMIFRNHQKFAFPHCLLNSAPFLLSFLPLTDPYTFGSLNASCQFYSPSPLVRFYKSDGDYDSTMYFCQ